MKKRDTDDLPLIFIIAKINLHNVSRLFKSLLLSGCIWMEGFRGFQIHRNKLGKDLGMDFKSTTSIFSYFGVIGVHSNDSDPSLKTLPNSNPSIQCNLNEQDLPSYIYSVNIKGIINVVDNFI